MLVRGGQLDGDAKVGFGGELEWELFLPAGEWETPEAVRVWDGRRVRLGDGWRVQRATMRISEDGCYGLQLDGDPFTQVIEFAAIRQPGPLK